MSEPRDFLSAPIPYEPVPDLVANILNFTSFVSPAYLGNLGATHFSGVDVLEWVGATMAGDWEAVQSAGIALKQLAEFNQTFADALRGELAHLEANWSGEAHDAAHDYLARVQAALEAQMVPLTNAGREIEQAAFGVYETAEAIKSTISLAFDYFAVAVVAALAAKATAGVSLAGTAAAVARGINLINQAFTAHSAALAMAHSVVGLTTGFLATAQAQPIPPLREPAIGLGGMPRG